MISIFVNVKWGHATDEDKKLTLAVIEKDYPVSSPTTSGNNLNMYKCWPLLKTRCDPYKHKRQTNPVSRSFGYTYC